MANLPNPAKAVAQGHGAAGVQAPMKLPRAETPVKGRMRFLSPVSGLAVLAVDNTFFGANVGTVGLALPVLCAMAFSFTSIFVFLIQRLREKDTLAKSAAKALFCGALAGVPTSIAGTALGSFVLLASGLNHFIGRRR